MATKVTLDGRLRAIVVSTGFPNPVPIQVPVHAGSRNALTPRGDTVLDGSARRRLGSMRQRMLHGRVV